MPPPKKTQNSSNLWKSIKPHKSARHFENEVIKFHSTQKTPIRHLPYVLGKRINLRKLYISVIKRGGYKKVNNKEVWEDVLSELNLPKEGTNCELAIQTIYHRYLEAYERNQWTCLGSGALIESDNDFDMGIDLSKHTALISDLTMRDRSVLGSFVYDNTPKIYSDYQHIISNTTRYESGLSCDLKEGTELKHLTMSLKSGLCNEIDLTLHTLLNMSNNDQLLPDLRFSGELIDLLVAVAGVVDIKEGSYYEHFKDYTWMKESLKFWNKTVKSGVGRMFLVPNIFACHKSDIEQIQRNCNTSCNSESNELFNDDHLYYQTTDPCCQRIHLVATVVHNLVINSLSNSQTIVNNNQALRFIFLGAHSKDSLLRQLSLHTLTRLRFVLLPIQDSSVSELNTLLYTTNPLDVINHCTAKDDKSDEQWFTEFILDFLMTLLSSDNRCDRISAYEIIQSLCFIEDNHETLSNHLQCPFIMRISSQLYIPDIHPLCCALEALISLSQLGEDMCRRMAMCKSFLKCLLQFVSVEAQMFGPLAVYKIKTFNSRPPNPSSNYHSLSQVTRPPAQSSLRPLAPFNPGGSSIPYFNHNLIRSPVINSISSQSLSIPFTDAIQCPQNIFPNNQTIAPNMSLLTPLQHIDNLLTKSISSFATNHQNLVISQPVNSIVDHLKCRSKEERSGSSEILEERFTKDNRVNERKIIQIKCCVDGVDLEIDEMNGTCKTERKLTLVNGTVCDIVANEDFKTMTGIGADDDSFKHDKEEQHFSNGTSLEVDISAEDEDPDRRQMPPPSLPTPSMLKKQMRPKSVPIVSTNGYVPQINCKDKCDTKNEERREQVKKWLKENYKITEDKNTFVTKQQLVMKLHNDLEFEDSDERKHVFSAHDLHVCMKEVFGQKVQVKVEHGVNGSCMLIYNNLGLSECAIIEEVVMNGVVNSPNEMNGFVSHSYKRKKSEEDIEDDIEPKTLFEANINSKGDDVMRKEAKDIPTEISKTSASNILLIKKKYKNRKMSQVKSGLKFKWRSYKPLKCSKTRLSQPRKYRSTTKNFFFPSSGDGLPTTVSICDVAPQVACLWDLCTVKAFDYVSLQTHITNDHLSQSAYDVSCPPRTRCLWRDCPSSHVPRASLSLLSHVVQEHCIMSYSLPTFPSIIPQYNPMVHGNILSHPLGNSLTFNTMMTPNIKPQNVITMNNQVHEKSGWSVIYDHFRMDEQCQPNLPEGPITKHIRISSSIILRNMSRHSVIAKDFLKSHEKYLSGVALSNQDCSSVIVQCLDELRVPLSGTDDHIL